MPSRRCHWESDMWSVVCRVPVSLQMHFWTEEFPKRIILLYSSQPCLDLECLCPQNETLELVTRIRACHVLPIVYIYIYVSIYIYCVYFLSLQAEGLCSHEGPVCHPPPPAPSSPHTPVQFSGCPSGSEQWLVTLPVPGCSHNVTVS